MKHRYGLADMGAATMAAEERRIAAMNNDATPVDEASIVSKSGAVRRI